MEGRRFRAFGVSGLGSPMDFTGVLRSDPMVCIGNHAKSRLGNPLPLAPARQVCGGPVHELAPSSPRREGRNPCLTLLNFAVAV